MAEFLRVQWLAVIALVFGVFGLAAAYGANNPQTTLEVVRQTCVDGAQGETGIQGEPGEQGEPGICGPQGIEGPAGPQGETGPRGATGAQGEQGTQGLQGVQGVQGEVGARGPTGATGPEGPAAAEVSYTVGGGTIGGSAPTFTGSPLFFGSSIRNGDLVFVRVHVNFDNITNFGTGQYYVTLPYPSKYSATIRGGYITDTSKAAHYAISGEVEAGETQLTLWYLSGGEDEPFEDGSPRNLQTTDEFHIAGSYIAEAQ